MKDPNSCDVSSKVHVKYLEVKYWTIFNKYFIPVPYLTDPISCEFFFHFEYLEPKYRTYWTVFDKYFISESYLMDLISCDFFSKVCFKYLEAKQRIFLVEYLSNGLFFKLILMILKWFECFPKRF